MQIIVFTEETGNLALHSGPYILPTNKIIELEGITCVEPDVDYYYANSTKGVALRLPINKTNVIYK
jgi:hypothetical protein